MVKLMSGGELPFVMPRKSERPARSSCFAFFSGPTGTRPVEFFRPPEKRAHHAHQLHNISPHGHPQDIQTLHGIVSGIAEGRKDRPEAACSTAPKP